MFEKLLFTLIGASIGWVLSWHRYRVAENANLISDHIKDIEKFSEELRQHWTTSFAGVDPNEHRAEIAKIKSLHISVSSFYGEAEYRLGKASIGWGRRVSAGEGEVPKLQRSST